MTERPCTFCDRNQFEERLVGETELFWVIATLGQITDGGYVLLVPKRHVLCLRLLDLSEQIEAAELYARLVFALCEKYVFPGIIFEHGIVGQTITHAHLHVIPANGIIKDRVVGDFPGRDTKYLGDRPWPQTIFGNNEQKQEPYLFWRDSVGATMLWDPPAPPQYLRIAVADMLGRPERANWRNMDPELDRRLWSETVSNLSPYFRKGQ